MFVIFHISREVVNLSDTYRSTVIRGTKSSTLLNEKKGFARPYFLVLNAIWSLCQWLRSVTHHLFFYLKSVVHKGKKGLINVNCYNYSESIFSSNFENCASAAREIVEYDVCCSVRENEQVLFRWFRIRPKSSLLGSFAKMENKNDYNRK